MSVFILDASYALTWCFADRCTPATDETLKRLESAVDHAMVPPIWKIEVANALGKAVTRRKVSLEQAKEIWEELAQLPISETSTPYDVPTLLELAVQVRCVLSAGRPCAKSTSCHQRSRSQRGGRVARHRSDVAIIPEMAVSQGEQRHVRGLHRNG